MQMRITLNGEKYQSVDDMPPHVRRKYEEAMKLLADRDGNGVPDVLESKDPTGTNVDVTTVTSSSVMLNGTRLDDPSRLLPEVRNLLQHGHGELTIHLHASTIFALISLVAFVALVIWWLR